MEGSDPVELWRRPEQEAAQSSKDYVGFDGAGVVVPPRLSRKASRRRAIGEMTNATTS